MAAKALVTGVEGPSLVNGVYIMAVTANVTSGESNVYVSAPISNANFNPLVPNWRSIAADAIKDQALSDWDITVDQVLFQDLQVLGV